MNLERLDTIAQWLEAGAPHKDGVGGFYMPAFFREDNKCGTTACIGGCAVMWWGSEEHKRCQFENWYIPRFDARQVAANLLGLSTTTANALFCPDSFPYTPGEDGPLQDRLEEVTPAWAARCIRHLMETGEVDWLGTQAA